MKVPSLAVPRVASSAGWLVEMKVHPLVATMVGWKAASTVAQKEHRLVEPMVEWLVGLLGVLKVAWSVAVLAER